MTGRRRQGRRRPPDPGRRRARTTSRPSSGSRSRNGLRVVVADLPGRPLVSATLVLRNGAADEPPAHAGATVLAARAMTEGTARYDAIALVEAAERLGASLHAEAGWDAIERQRRRAGGPPRGRSRAARRGRPPPDVPRGGGRAAPRRAAQRPAPGPGRPAPPRRRGVLGDDLRGGVAVPPTGRRDHARPSRSSTPARLRAAYERGLDPARATFIVGGDLRGHRRPRRSPSGCSAAGGRRSGRRRAAGSSTRARSASGSSGSSIGRAPSRPRSGSATSACRAGSTTSTPSR